MKLRICKCTQCRYGRRSSFSQAIIRRAKRHNRQQCRIKLLKGDYDNIVNVTPQVYVD